MGAEDGSLLAVPVPSSPTCWSPVRSLLNAFLVGVVCGACCGVGIDSDSFEGDE